MFCKYKGEGSERRPQPDPETVYWLKFGSELLGGGLHVSIVGRADNEVWYKHYNSFEDFQLEWELV